MPRYCVLIKEAAPLDCSVPNWSVMLLCVVSAVKLTTCNLPCKFCLVNKDGEL